MTIASRFVILSTICIFVAAAAGTALAEPQSCLDLKTKVCTICGEGSPGCEALKDETDTEENCTMAIELIDELEQTLSQLDEETRKKAWGEFCTALAEE